MTKSALVEKPDFKAEMVCDSIAPNGVRLRTMLLTYPRFIHSELMTHRAYSRNAASSRAIPVKKKLARMELNPVEPVEWGVNKPGMQATEICDAETVVKAKALWHRARRVAMRSAAKLDDLKLHKQVANRITEPWDWMVTLVTGTNFANWDALRDHEAADPNIKKLAVIRKAVEVESKPKLINYGQWHLPFIKGEDWDQAISQMGVYEEALGLLLKVSAGRCARLSYLTFDGKRDLQEDVNLHNRLTTSRPGHWSPLEHQATPIPFRESKANAQGICEFCRGVTAKPRLVTLTTDEDAWLCEKCSLGWITSGNLFGWRQYRKQFEDEYIKESYE